jgi:hypothetical protein
MAFPQLQLLALPLAQTFCSRPSQVGTEESLSSWYLLSPNLLLSPSRDPCLSHGTSSVFFPGQNALPSHGSSHLSVPLSLASSYSLPDFSNMSQIPIHMSPPKYRAQRASCFHVPLTGFGLDLVVSILPFLGH